jgi:hypothetical protein
VPFFTWPICFNLCKEGFLGVEVDPNWMQALSCYYSVSSIVSRMIF